MKHSSEHFAETMRSKRAASNLSQIELANELGITQSRVSLYERGHITPSFPTAVKIADALGCSLDEFAVAD